MSALLLISAGFMTYGYHKFKLMKHDQLMTHVNNPEITKPHNTAVKRYTDSNIYENSLNKRVATTYLKKISTNTYLSNLWVSFYGPNPKHAEDLNKLWHYYNGPVRHVMVNNAYSWSYTINETEISFHRNPVIYGVLKDNCEDMTSLLYIMLELCVMIKKTKNGINNDSQIANIIHNYEMLGKYIDHIPECKGRIMSATDVKLVLSEV